MKPRSFQYAALSLGTPLPSESGLTLLIKSPAEMDVAPMTPRLPSMKVIGDEVASFSIVTWNRRLVSQRNATADPAAAPAYRNE